MNNLAEYLNATIRSLESNIDNEIYLILMEVGNNAVRKINKYISDWYNQYTPIDYQRTDELRDCARFSIEGRTVRVYLDMRRLRSSMQNNGNGWQAHRGFDGEDFTYGLIDFLENGSDNKGSIRNPRRDDFGIHMLEQTQEWINKYIQKEVEIRINAMIRQNYKR